MSEETIRAIIVEDSEVVSQMIRNLLAQAKISADCVGTLKAALSRLESPGVDCIVLDLMLPDAVDLEGLTAIQARFAAIPVVIFTGAGLAFKEQAMRQGARDYIEKKEEHTLVKAIKHAVLKSEVAEWAEPARSSLDDTGKALERADKIYEEFRSVVEDSKVIAR